MENRSEEEDGTATILMIMDENYTQSYQLIISDELMRQLYIYVFILLNGCIAIFGMVSNVINMKIFVRLSLKDSMSVCLFSLSFTDFLLSTLSTVDRVFPIWNFFYNNEGIDPRAVFYISLAWVMDSLFLVSGLILTFMSLERCICVTFPFKVRRIFTRDRAIVTMVLIYVVTMSSYIPLYMTQWLAWVQIEVNRFNGSSFVSRLVVMFSDGRPRVQSYVSIFSAAFLQFPSMVITLGSVVLMVRALISSSRLRKSMTSAVTDNGGEKDEANLDHKTRTLVKVVCLLAFIFMLSSIPRVVAVTIKLIYPEIKEDGRERNLNDFQWQLGRLLATINASVNIFVYLKINASFRAKFREIFISK